MLLLRLGLPEGTSDEARHAIAWAGQAAYGIAHPNVLSTLAVLESKSEVRVVYEYADAKPLRTLLEASQGGVSIGVALRIVLDIVEGLERFHALPSGPAGAATFGGMSPDSVVVTASGVTKLCNLPLASAACGLEAIRVHPDKLAYAAPEQLHRGAALTPQCDLFSVGALLWELLSGRPLLTGGRSEIERALQEHDFPELPPQGAGAWRIPARLAALVSTALSAEPEARPTSARDLDRQLRKCGCPIATHRAVAKLLRERLASEEGSRSQSPFPGSVHHVVSLPSPPARDASFLTPRRWILLSSGVVVIVAGAIAHRFLPEEEPGFDAAPPENPHAAAQLATAEPQEPELDMTEPPAAEPTAAEPTRPTEPTSLTEPASALDPSSPEPGPPSEPEPGALEPSTEPEPPGVLEPPSLPEPPAGGADELADDFRAGKLLDEHLARAFALEHSQIVPPCPQLPGSPKSSVDEPVEEAEAHLSNARHQLVQGHLERARSELCAVLTLDPGNSDARRDLAELALGLGDAARAKQVAEEGLSEHDPDPELVGLLGDALAMLGELEESRRVWLPLAQPHGSKAQRIRRLTTYFLRLGKTAYDGRAFARARNLYRRAVILSSGSLLSSLRLAEALVWMDEKQAALVWARRAARRMYRGWRAQMVLGDALAKTGDEDGARKQWEKARRLYPGSTLVARRLRHGLP